ncbi:DUF7673 family protein [Trinickia mobilis]|uniref:DUF7673 family protein n=1 Tax=Trinickia mobilis TaxID=2816356 RepID=UPI001A8F89E7|nr:hypothetical protein [Trinickia mobilis]
MKMKETPSLCNQFADAPGAQAARRLFEACHRVGEDARPIAEFLVSLCTSEWTRIDAGSLCRRIIDDALFTDIIAVMTWLREGRHEGFDLPDIFGSSNAGYAVILDLMDRFEIHRMAF